MNTAKGFVYDDNSAAIHSFVWSAGWPQRGKNCQYNHVWSGQQRTPEQVVEVYTALWNIVVTPAFLAKLTDTNDDVKAVLRQRVMDLYGSIPGVDLPLDPTPGPQFDDLVWAPHPPPMDTDALRAHIEKRLAKNQGTNVALSVREFGWALSSRS